MIAENENLTQRTDNVSLPAVEPILRPSVDTILGPALEQLNKSIRNVSDKYEKLNDLDGALIDFNRSFGSFLFGLQANNETIHWKHSPTDQSVRQYITQKQQTTTNTTHLPTTQHKEAITDVSVPAAPSTSTENKARKRRSTAPKPLPVKKKKIESKVENGYTQKVLEALIAHPNGLSRKDLVKATDIPQPKVIDCLQVLNRSKVITTIKVPIINNNL
ncbi:hypothetical protein RO3G_00632 [Rhizopus delemar RA 99-880]|uniref:Uncharacterized protein n=1 Tax=Rhizopus delemar (strain RA 99-880 / ATCC MYA-4621 / FGSC 9543 / NRRL 43880) TaxID=246409 RepID=I1BI98_RHIO9|nr:hypothetical protein RO3G_00632 [Rhizopus delemar RA 99-880]|eukprot:EIE75928.1 hypothetical protein RO3G_00632 [Rhizopus delemar RA 99-880]